MHIMLQSAQKHVFLKKEYMCISTKCYIEPMLETVADKVSVEIHNSHNTISQQRNRTFLHSLVKSHIGFNISNIKSIQQSKA